MTGTPACIWRSTGELVAVNKEFLFLTGWNLSLLVERPCRIYELFDKDTFLNYYEEFGKSFSDACISHFLISCQIAKFPIAAAPTTLPMSGERQLSPQEWLPFQCWATIKRDIYDIPLMIMGHFLPSF